MEKIDFKKFHSSTYYPCFECGQPRFSWESEKCTRCDYFIAYQLLKEVVSAEDRCRFCIDKETLDGTTVCGQCYQTTDECPALELDLEAIYACTME